MDILYALPILVTVVGAWLLFKLRFFFICHPMSVGRKILVTLRREDAFYSTSLALAGTLGIGNIIGVAVGISIGGAGSVFWLLVSSVFALTLKYCESALSSEMGGGKGILGVIEKSFGAFSMLSAKIYAVLILGLTFVMGAGLQSASVGECASGALNISPVCSAVFLTVSIILGILACRRRIDKITAISIPLTTIIYITLTISTIILNFERIPNAISTVFFSAFEVNSAVGGAVGFLLSDKIREGYLRGILSNEAGAGTSTIAHSINRSEDSGAVGVMGMLEVLFDTVILCMLTALAILVSLEDFSALSGVEMILLGIGGVFGKVSEYLVLVCIFAFAYSTVVCWYHYGSFAYEYLIGAKSGRAFFSLFIISVFLGAQTRAEVFIGFSDILLLFLSVITLTALIKNSDRIKLLSEKSGLLPIKR